MTQVRVELEIVAQKMISQFIINNSIVEKEIEQGFKQAFERFDFVKVIENATLDTIKCAIQDSANYGKIREMVKRKADDIIDDVINKSFNQLKINFGG